METYDVYTKINDEYHPTRCDGAKFWNRYFDSQVLAITQAQYPKVKFILDESGNLLFNTKNTELCDRIQKAFDRNHTILCGFDPDNDDGEFIDVGEDEE
jgi:hypothetical protein